MSNQKTANAEVKRPPFFTEHKDMSIDSTLEETLLHTFEIVGEGVASPHTKTTLRFIEELKKKHGIDYDVHASYRFVEK